MTSSNLTTPDHLSRYSHQCGGQRTFTVAPLTRSTRIGDHLAVLKDGSIIHTMKSTKKGLQGHPMNLVRCESPAGHISLPWHKVGVFESAGVDTSRTVTFKMQDVVGKAMICGDIVSTWKPEWIMSKKKQ